MNRRTFLRAAAGACGFVSACKRDTRKRLNVLNWGDYIDPAVLARFERDAQVRVRYATYENNEEMLGKVMSGNSGWDVVFPTHNRVQPMRELELIAPLDSKRITGASDLAPGFRNPTWDPNLEWSIPYLWTTTGIAYNRKHYAAAAAAAPAAWADLWRESVRGKLTMLDDVDDVFGAALAKLGLPYASSVPEDLRRAQKEIVSQKPLVRAYLSSEARDQMVAGDVLVAQTFATTAQLAIDGNTDVSFIHPREEFAAYCDCAVILRESSRKELAHEFLSFLLKPDVSLQNARKIRTATPVSGALNLMTPEERANVTLYPSAETMKRASWPQSLPPEIVTLRDRLWTEAKSA